MSNGDGQTSGGSRAGHKRNGGHQTIGNSNDAHKATGSDTNTHANGRKRGQSVNSARAAYFMARDNAVKHGGSTSQVAINAWTKESTKRSKTPAAKDRQAKSASLTHATLVQLNAQKKSNATSSPGSASIPSSK